MFDRHTTTIEARIRVEWASGVSVSKRTGGKRLIELRRTAHLRFCKFLFTNFKAKLARN